MKYSVSENTLAIYSLLALKGKRMIHAEKVDTGHMYANADEG